MRRDGADLRSQGRRLRALSCALREQSRGARQTARHALAAARVPRTPRRSGAAPGPSERSRLLDAQADLQSAIAECSAALDQVRLELGWSDARPSRLVH